MQRLWNRLRPLFWNLSASVIGQGATLTMTTMLANALAPAEFGRFSVTTSTVLALSALAQCGFAFTVLNFVARYVGKDPDRARRIAEYCVSRSSLIGLGFGISLSCSAWVVARYLYGEPSLFSILIVAAAGLPMATLNLVQSSIFIGLQAFRSLASNAAVYAITALAGSAVGYYIDGAFGASLGYVVAINLRAVHGMMVLRSIFAPLPPWRQPQDAKALFRELLPFLLPTALTALTVTPVVWISNAWLVNARGLIDLGLFSTAFLIKTLVVFIPIQIGNVFLPKYVETGETDPIAANLYLHRIMAFVFLFSAVTAATVALVAPTLMTVFGTEFAPAATALRWLMAAVVAESVATMGSYRLAGDRRMWMSLLAYTMPKDLLLLATAFALAPTYGASGVAVAHLASWLYGLCVILVLTFRPPRTAAIASEI